MADLLLKKGSFDDFKLKVNLVELLLAFKQEFSAEKGNYIKIDILKFKIKNNKLVKYTLNI